MRHGWSLVKLEWNSIPHKLVNSKIWRSVQFNISDINSVPSSPGVYIICSSPPGRRRNDKVSPNDLFALLYNAIYVGKSENLRERFQNHCNKPKKEIVESRTCFEDSLDFWFFRLDASEIAYAEAHLIDCLGPPANTVRGIISATLQGPIPA